MAQPAPPEAVAVPDVIGMTAGAAADALTEVGLVPDPRNRAGDSGLSDEWLVTARISSATEAMPGESVGYYVESPLASASRSCGANGSVGDQGRSIALDSGYKNGKLEEVVCVLVALKTPDSVLRKMDTTRALDGRQQASWEDISASWTYHPDSGLDVIIELTE